MAQKAEEAIKRAMALECGRRLARARKAEKHRQSDLAKLTGWSEDHPNRGLSPSRIANYEQGTRQIGHYEADIFSQVYKQYHLAYFLGAIGEREAIVLKLIEQSTDPLPPFTPSKPRRIG